jgi:hypothetical protein
LGSGEEVAELMRGVNVVVVIVGHIVPVGVKWQAGISSVIPVWTVSVLSLLMETISSFEIENW